MSQNTTPQKQRARLINEILTLIFVLGIVIGVYVLVVRFLDYRFDVTTAGQFSMSDTTVKLLERVKAQKKSIKVTVFYRPDKNPEEGVKRRKVFDLLTEYHLRSGKVIEPFRVLNPDQHPDDVQRLGVRNIGTVVFELDGGDADKPVKQVIAPRDIWGIRMVDGRPGPDEFKGENAFSSGLQRLLEAKQVAVCFVQGHGEFSMTSREVEGLRDFADALELFNFSARPINLVQENKIPDDAQVVAVIGPKKAFLPAEADILTRYAQAGGHLLLLIDYNTQTGLEPLFKYLGVELGNNLVLEPARAYQGNLISPVPLYGGDHVIVKELQAAGENMLLNTARSVERALGDTRSSDLTNLLITSPSAWAEANYLSKGKNKEVKYDEGSGDLKGPVTLALAVTRTGNDNHQVRAVVAGDAEFATNQMIKFGSNKDFLLNATRWLAGNEGGIGISPKDPLFNYVTMTNRQVWGVFIIVILMLPGMVLAGGIFQWLNRRSL